MTDQAQAFILHVGRKTAEHHARVAKLSDPPADPKVHQRVASHAPAALDGGEVSERQGDQVFGLHGLTPALRVARLPSSPLFYHSVRFVQTSPCVQTDAGWRSDRRDHLAVPRQPDGEAAVLDTVEQRANARSRVGDGDGHGRARHDQSFAATSSRRATERSSATTEAKTASPPMACASSSDSEA